MYIFLQNYKKFRIRESGFIPKTPTELNITQRVAKVVEFNLGVIFDKIKTADNDEFLVDNQLQSDINKAREVVYKLTPEGRQGKITLDSPITLFDKDFRQGAVNNLVAAGKRYLKDICELTDAQFEIIGLNRTEINNVRVILYELTPEGRQGKISLKAPIAMFFDRFGQGSVNRFIESGYTHLSDLQGLGYDDIHKITKNNLTTKYIIELINSNTIDSPL